MGILSSCSPTWNPRPEGAGAPQRHGGHRAPAFLRFAPLFQVGYNSNVEAVAFLQHSNMLMLYMPCLVFIDQDGVIRAQYEGRDSFLEETSQESIRAKLEDMLAKPPAKKPPAKKTKSSSK